MSTISPARCPSPRRASSHSARSKSGRAPRSGVHSRRTRHGRTPTSRGSSSGCCGTRSTSVPKSSSGTCSTPRWTRRWRTASCLACRSRRAITAHPTGSSRTPASHRSTSRTAVLTWPPRTAAPRCVSVARAIPPIRRRTSSSCARLPRTSGRAMPGTGRSASSSPPAPTCSPMRTGSPSGRTRALHASTTPRCGQPRVVSPQTPCLSSTACRLPCSRRSSRRSRCRTC